MSTRVRTLINKLFGKKESYRVLITGLDAAGKTAILYRLVLGEVVTTIPTIGFNVETFVFQNTSLTIWDVGGCDKIRQLIRHYLDGTQAIIFVIDSGDRERLNEAKDGLCHLMAAEESMGAPLLIYLNKTDLSNGMSSEYVTEKMGLNTLKGKAWFVQPCSVLRDEGLSEGISWLVRVMNLAPSKFEQVETQVTSRISNTSEEEKYVQWLAKEDEDTMEEYIENFCSQQILTDNFDHRSLLRIVWSCLQVFGRKDAVKKIFDNIRFYLPETNETLIYFWIQMVHYARETTKNSSNNFNDFLIMNPQLLNEIELPLTYYSKQTLYNDQAKSTIVLPDIKQLPSILPKVKTTASSIEVKKVDDQEEIVQNLDNDEFLRQFESCTLTSWSHKTHLRMAWLYLTRYGRREGVNKIFDGIKNFIDNSQVSRKTTFHFTMTYFWIQMIDLAIAMGQKDVTFDEFIQLNPQLMNGGLFLEYYKKETMLNNPKAREEFILPDIKPLPTVVVKSNKK